MYQVRSTKYEKLKYEKLKLSGCQQGFGSGSALDPHSAEMLDPDPDPDVQFCTIIWEKRSKKC